MATKSFTISYDDSDEQHILDATQYSGTDMTMDHTEYIARRTRGHILAEVLNWDENEQSGPLSAEPGYTPDYDMFGFEVND